MSVEASEVVRKLQGFLQPTAIVSHPVLLQETNPDGQHPPIRVSNTGGAVFVSFDRWFNASECKRKYCPDAGDLAGRLYPLFVDGREVRRSSDYLCFHAHDDILWVLMFELKSMHSDGARLQIVCTSRLAEYFIRVALQAVKESDWPRIEYRGVVIKEQACHQKRRQGAWIQYDPDRIKSNLAYATVKRENSYALDIFLCWPRFADR